MINRLQQNKNNNDNHTNNVNTKNDDNNNNNNSAVNKNDNNNNNKQVHEKQINNDIIDNKKKSRNSSSDDSSSGDSDSDSSSSSSDDEEMHRKLVFVPKNQRGKHNKHDGGSSSINKIISSKNIGSKSTKDRVAASRKMVIDATVVIETSDDEDDVKNKMPDDTDDINIYEEMKAWRIREAIRVEKFKCTPSIDEE